MFKNNLSELFPFAHTLYDISELILVGSDIPSWLDIVSGHGPEKVHYINQSEKNYNFDSLPPNWQVSSKLLAKEDGDITFYTLNNPMLNGTVSSDLLANLWQNLTTLETAQKEALSLKSYMDKECSASSSKMIVVDSFDGLALVDELDSSQVDVVALRVVADDEEAFTNVSELKVKQKLQEYGYKNIATYEDNHPKIKTAVYVKDMKRQTRECEENLNFVKQNAQKELTITVDAKEQELANLKSELETKNRALQEKQANSEQLQHQKTELENKTKTLEENLQQITSAKEALQKESATTNKIKEQEINNLKSDLENLNESNIKLASALEEQKKLHTEHLALNTQKTKELQENVNKERAAKEALQKELSEVKTQLEYKTKELAATNQTKEQELAKLKSELETKNRALQEKQANSEQLQHQKVELNTKVETLQNEKQSLEEKLKTIPELENKIKTLADTTQKEISELKTANQTKEQELVKLRSELETKNKEVQEKQANSEQLQTLQIQNKEIKKALEAKIEEINGHFLKRKQQAIEGEETIKKLKIERDSACKERDELKKKLKYSGDAKIDEFINDIAPFFYNKAITYVDVGAYVGEVFMKLRDLKKFSIREAHLFEPNPESYEQMLENLKSYKLTSLNTYNFGIGKTREIANFISSKSMTKKHEIDFTSNKENIFQSEIVPLVDMSSVFTEGHIHLLKIDVEGSEMGVLKGASSLLESQAIDVIYMEVGFNKKGTQQTYFCILDKYMQNFGYRVFKFYEQKYEWIEDLPYLRRGNVAYISTKFAKANPSKLVFQNNQLKQELENLKKGKEK